MKKKINNFLKYSPYFFYKKFSFFFKLLSEFEYILIKTKKINKPIFVCGYPRSGTTIITHMLNLHDKIGSLNYSDLPFLKNIIFWKFFSRFYYSNINSSKRMHSDDIYINKNSPDAFEELIWSENLENYNDKHFKILTKQYSNTKLETELKININKVLYLRKKDRYLSKGNNYIFRLDYLIKIYSNPFILIVVRNPLLILASSLRVDKLFRNIADENKYFIKELDFLCHKEFGYNKKNILNKVTSTNLNQLYLTEWIKIHRYILIKIIKNDFYKKYVKIVISDELSKNDKYIKNIFNFCELKINEGLNKKIKKIYKIQPKIEKNKLNILEIKALKLYDQIINQINKY